MATDSVTQSLLVDAPLGTVYDTVGDFESYPEWLKEFKEARITQTREDGWANKVDYVMSSMGITLNMTLAYTYTDTRVEWTLVDGNMMTKNDGAYDMVDNGDDTTTLTYELAVETSVPVPSMIRKQIAKKSVTDSLKAIKRRAET